MSWIHGCCSHIDIAIALAACAVARKEVLVRWQPVLSHHYCCSHAALRDCLLTACSSCTGIILQKRTRGLHRLNLRSSDGWHASNSASSSHSTAVPGVHQPSTSNRVLQRRSR